MISRTQAIKAFLMQNAPSDLAALYNHNMEVQVNVDQGKGEIEDGTSNGRKFKIFRDPTTKEIWKSLRIPYNVQKEPVYEDKSMFFDLTKHALAIGMTGWNWVTKSTHWVGFDVDSMKSHNTIKSFSEEDLEIFEEKYNIIKYGDLRRSKSGAGLHIYVHFTNPIPSSYLEHKAIARAVLQDMCKIANYNFDYQVDKLGGILWAWHRDTVPGKGLLLVRKGLTLDGPPKYWQEHLDVVSGRRKRTVPTFISESNKSEEEKIFNEIVGRRSPIQRDDEHQRLINWIEEKGLPGYWNEDRGLYCTHTYILKEAHKELNLKGLFDTISTGKDYGNDLNSFLFPLKDGAWVVRRFSPGCAEHISWEQDKQGYTKCIYNRKPDLDAACRTFNGNEHTAGGNLFNNTEDARDAIKSLGIDFEFPEVFKNREIILKKHKDKRLIIIVARENSDDKNSPAFKGWTPEKNKWTKILNIDVSKPIETQMDNWDSLIRHLISEGNEDFGWVIYSDNRWNFEPLSNVKATLKFYGLSPYEADQAIGSMCVHPFIMTNNPFEDEWDKEGRKWNKYAARLKYKESSEQMLIYPTFQKILNHCGESLNISIKNNNWCKLNNINTGYDYLFAWCASLFQQPRTKLPYLFLFGPQNSGKSSFHNMLSMLLINGVVRAEQALTSTGGFNAELEFALLSIVEEINLKKNRTSYERIKDWVTSGKISIHRKGLTPYITTNTNHFVHCANDASACPVFGGDTRVTMAYVGELTKEELIPQHKLEIQLNKEAPDFLAAIKRYKLPEPHDRLGISPLTTDIKEQIEENNLSQVETFLKERCYYVEGEVIKYNLLYEEFIKWLDPSDRFGWSIRKFGPEIPQQKYPKGRMSYNSGFHIGNISFEPKESTKSKLARINETLEHIGE